MLDKILGFIRKFIPKKVFSFFQPFYHITLSFLGALFYRFPSRKIKILGITGTKGKSSTVEIVNKILEEAGIKTAIAGTIRFKIGDSSKRNLYKMTMPGRFAMQKFLRDAVSAGCQWAIIEMTSEGTKLYRHKFIELNSLIFTNISPEHIEAHGSYEKYLEAKLKIAKSLEKSSKKERFIIANADDKESRHFLDINVEHKRSFSLKEMEPYKIRDGGLSFTFNKTQMESNLQGLFNLYNLLSGIVFAESIGITTEVMRRAIENIQIKGRVEKVEEGQNFPVVVDYAHTIDSLQKFYEVFKDRNNVCVLGNTGGGRDKWKRKGMAEIAEKYCTKIILTNEDPYDEDPRAIVEQMAEGIKNKEKLEIIMDRREAIRKALEKAPSIEKSSVLITGKGTDPYIMEAGGKKTPWSDEEVAREELRKMLGK